MKFFTPEEASGALEVVRPLVERLVERRRELLRREAQLEVLRAKVAGNGGGLDPGKLAELQAAAAEALADVAAVIQEVHALGIQVKDLDRGLVDFPARHPEDGTVVLLCWHLGEEEIGFWHGLEDGFAGRKPLPF